MTDICPELFKDGAASFGSQEKEVSHYSLSAIFLHSGTNLGSYYQPKALISNKSRKMFLINSSDFSNH